MRLRCIGAAGAIFVAALAAAPASAAPDNAAVKQTIRSLFAKANKGDSAGMLASFDPNASVIDNFAPFRWDNPQAWLNAFGGYSSANAVAGSHFTIVKFAHVNVADGRAYAVVNLVLRYRENGKPKKEDGTDVITLEKNGGGWRATSFSWFGQTGNEQGADAEAVVAAAKSFASLTVPISPTSVADEFPPFHWTGPNAESEWGDAFQKLSAAAGTSDTALSLAAPSELDINGDKAYADFPTVIAYKEHGKPKTEHGRLVFALDKAADGWHITSWAWATK